MAEITNEMVRELYSISKKIYESHISNKVGLDEIEVKLGMNRNSAGDYIHNYKCMIEGRRFPRTNNAYGTRYYLEEMYRDGGRHRLLNALSALKQHIDYYESIGNGRVILQKQIYEEFCIIAKVYDDVVYPDEVLDDNDELLEGKTRQAKINIYERNPVARAQCIAHYGCKCFICCFDFEEAYGELGKSFIHVHHLLEIATIGKQYSIDPIKDLRPLCPNCHAMVHKRKPAYSIDEIKAVLSSSAHYGV